jgi:hypothetical protein
MVMMCNGHNVYMLQGYLARESLTKIGYGMDAGVRCKQVRHTEKSRGILDAIDDSPVATFGPMREHEAISLEAWAHDRFDFLGVHVWNEWFAMTDEFLDFAVKLIVHCHDVKVERLQPTKTHLFDPDRSPTARGWKARLLETRSVCVERWAGMDWSAFDHGERAEVKRKPAAMSKVGPGPCLSRKCARKVGSPDGISSKS